MKIQKRSSMNFSSWLKIPLLKNGPAMLGTASISEIVSSVPGIHAARPQTPFQTLISRNPSLEYSDLFRLTNEGRHFIRLRCMRGTLHIVPVEIAPILHFSTLRQRIAKCEQMAKRIPNYLNESVRAEQWIRERIARKGFISERPDEAQACIDTRITKETFRVKLKELWELGEISFQDNSLHWHRERRVFIDTRLAYGDILDMESRLEEIFYQIELAHLYFSAFGPATFQDFCWWTGLPASVCAKAISALQERSLREFVSEGHKYFHFDSDTQVDRPRFLDDDALSFLPWEDYSLKAYHETRFRYGDSETLRRAFNSIGEVRRTIVRNGTIIGVWDVDAEGLPATLEVFDPGSVNMKNARDRFDAMRVAVMRNTPQCDLFGEPR